MLLCRQVLFPLMDRFSRDDVRALSSTSKSLRRACSEVCPGYWRDRLLRDPDFAMEPKEMQPVVESVHFLHYISRWSPWRVSMRKYDTLVCGFTGDGLVISTDKKNVVAVRHTSAYDICRDLQPQPAERGYKHVSAGYGVAAFVTQEQELVVTGLPISGIGPLLAVPTLTTVTYATVGPRRVVAIDGDGLLVVWGSYVNSLPPQPEPGTWFVSACSSVAFDMALRSDGVVVVWNCLQDAWDCQLVPPLPAGIRCIQISAGERHACALRSDGSIVVWGADDVARSWVPPVWNGTWYTCVKTENGYNVALRTDGVMVLWKLSMPHFVLPPSGERILEFSLRSFRCMILCSDGKIYDTVWNEVQRALCERESTTLALHYVCDCP